MRRAVLVFSDKLLTDFLKGFIGNKEYSLKIIKYSLPIDTKIIRMGHDIQGTAYMVLESIEFEDIIEGCNYPVLDCPHIQRKELEAIQ